jgi:hypothetical protein
MLVAALVSVCAGISAQEAPKEDYQWWHSCQQMIDECKNTSAEDLWWAASIDEHPGPALPYGDGPFLGLCYTHDWRSCPNCACDDYVKISHFPNPKGWDHNGSNYATGCMGLKSTTSRAASHAAAAAKIKELCESGACCCPNVEPDPDCPNQADIKARDPITGSCCTFPDICSAPSDWEKPIAPWDARCDPRY